MKPEPIPTGTYRLFSNASAVRWLWLLPFGAALAYPFFLDAFHSSVSTASPGWWWLLCAFLVPFVGLAAAHRLRRAAHGQGAALLSLRLAHAVVAAPPLFTLMGVLLYLMKIYGHDNAVWLGLCLAGATFGLLSMLVTADAAAPAVSPEQSRHYRALRTVHGVTSLLLLLVFLAPHLFNHVVGLWGVDAHRAVMKVLRQVYRAGLLEPLIIAVFGFQVLSGLVLFRRKSAANNDVIDTLQTGSGIYLTVFIASHINSVFTLGRYFGTDTDYAWAVGAPTGLLRDAWNIRLLPHYALAVAFLIAHLGAATRLIMRKHGASARTADTVAWTIVAGGIALSAAITAGMLGARVHGGA